uniref:Midasin n=1 Tax=Oryzias melastigma TaxID=30732 RepID=A0A3B3CZB6_ORYME
MENLEVSLSCLGFICRHADRSQRELKALLSKQIWNHEDRQCILECLAQLLLEKEHTLLIARHLRPLLLDLLERSAQRVRAGGRINHDLHERLCVALSRLLGICPDAHFASRYFSSAPPVFQRLFFSNEEASAVQYGPRRMKLRDLMGATLRFLQSDCGRFGSLWDWSPCVSQLQTSDAMVRYTAQCLALVCHMTDNQKAVFLKKLLTNEEILHMKMSLEESRHMETEKALVLANQSAVTWHQEAANKFTRGQVVSEDLSPNVVAVCGVVLPTVTPRQNNQKNLVLVGSTCRDLTRLALAVASQKPVLVEGPIGCGKTALVEFLAATTGHLKASEIMKVQLGDQTDSKMLLGMYRCTDIPGKFVWQPGTLTQAVTKGQWILLEDIDHAPLDVVSVLLPLMENKKLLIPGRDDSIDVAPGFQFFATRGRSWHRPHNSHAALLDKYWSKLQMGNMTRGELKTVLVSRYPGLSVVSDRLLDIYCQLTGDRHSDPNTNNPLGPDDGREPPAEERVSPLEGRALSLDLLKWCERISVNFDNSSSATGQLVFLEALDCFTAMLSSSSSRLRLAEIIGSKLNITKEKQAQHFCQMYQPSVRLGELQVSVGRATLQRKQAEAVKETFAATRASSVLLEQLAVCVAKGEPVLLVGETGTGKTSTVQHLARVTHRLRVVNMNQQSDTADLLGYKPVDHRQLLLPLREAFEDLFSQTYSRKQNLTFLGHVQTCFRGKRWQDLLKLMEHVCKSALTAGLREKSNASLQEQWEALSTRLSQTQQQIRTCETAMVFAFVEGTLAQAVKKGHWILLDEINLAAAETLECLSGLLEGSAGSLVLLDRGDTPLVRHPDFRLFACMNPATDVGKRNLPLGLRNLTELYVEELENEGDLRILVSDYLKGLSTPKNVVSGIIFYLNVRKEANTHLVDGTGHRPHYSLRTLCRALKYVAGNPCQSVQRSLYEQGFCLSFLTQLDRSSHPRVQKLVCQHILMGNTKCLKQSIPAPPGRPSVHIEGYWVSQGEMEPALDPSYILTTSVKLNLCDLARVVSATHPVLIQGETSVGKTSLIRFLAAATGNQCVRINNHEHTDIQEYIGCYSSDSRGKLVFKEVLIDAMRKGYWIILDELNLAPTDVLEALNRLLDDNRELFVAETQEVVKAHPRFMLFATQNPPGLYGGRKVLSRAFRNRFVELHFDELPSEELESILHQRCSLPPSYCSKLVKVMLDLQSLRRGSSVFAGKHGFITLRDLFRWADRYRLEEQTEASRDWLQHLADDYMLLAGRVRRPEEEVTILSTLEKHFKRKVNPEALFCQEQVTMQFPSVGSVPEGFGHVVWTGGMRRLAVLVGRALRFGESVLLVGDTCGKTTICQMFAALAGQKLYSVNCHLHMETSDFLGGLRPTDAEDGRLFEWHDGPLVLALKGGGVFLMDEISLADDSVLERLNVLETEKCLVLAEKGSGDDNDVELIKAHETFRLVATMNPGGDFGKKELSPALRNRFTEIWCPQSNSRSDLVQIIHHNLHSDLSLKRDVAELMLDFIDWLTHQDFGRRCILSVRDVLSWVDFLNAVSERDEDGLMTMGPVEDEEMEWDLRLDWVTAFIHAACLVYIDSIGSTTASCADGALLARRLCLGFLQQRLSKLTELDGGMLDALRVYDSRLPRQPRWGEDFFGIDPFYIALPCTDGRDLADYAIAAGTTAVNAQRLLRALKLRRPVLLEGSPGVGKTSLVAALAKASGNHLVRINLSEQTDVTDLFGTDLPVEGGKGGEFAWRDGPLLAALKAGHWVVLDELNLASQSVLEGLNACFDHRAEIYIPELGLSFQVQHEKTKIFGCQNPFTQGGGRKGLPKSFLNRFTQQVFVDQLSSEDMEFIADSIFPNIDDKILVKMVEFSNRLVQEVCVQRLWGQQGSPWEFNLRDMFRWCQLMQNDQSPGRHNPGQHVGLVYADRMRSEADKAQVLLVFREVFGEDCSPYCGSRHFHITPLSLQVGFSVLPRSGGSALALDPPLSITHQALRPLESLMKCVEMGWMAILVGPTGSGKTSLVRLLALLTGRRLRVMAMNSAMDTTELLGGFEQVDIIRQWQQVLETVEDAVAMVTRRGLMSLEVGIRDTEFLLHSWGLFCRWQKDEGLQRTGGALSSEALNKLEVIVVLLHKLNAKLKVFADLSTLQRDFTLLKRRMAQQEDRRTNGGFEWLDGMLVQALQAGDWLLMDNVNFCASVLDRLNALLEPNGSLTVSERGVIDGKTPKISPHPNFLFLTMDPAHGELSRAMRNRGVELFIPGEHAEVFWDSLDLKTLLHTAGVTGKCVCNLLIDIHKGVKSAIWSPASSMASLLHAAALLSSQLHRGLDLCGALRNACGEAYAACQRTPASQKLAQQVIEQHLAVLDSEAWGGELLCPGVWPDGLPSALLCAEDSCFSSVLRDGQVLLFCLNSLSLQGKRSRPLSFLDLQRALQGSGVHEDPHVSGGGAGPADPLRLLPTAVRLVTERASHGDWILRSSWLSHLMKSFQHSPPVLVQMEAGNKALKAAFKSKLGTKGKSLAEFLQPHDTDYRMLVDMRWNRQYLEILVNKSHFEDEDRRREFLQTLDAVANMVDVAQLPHPVLVHLQTFFQLWDSFVLQAVETGQPSIPDPLMFEILQLLQWRDRFWDVCCSLPADRQGVAVLSLHWQWMHKPLLLRLPALGQQELQTLSAAIQSVLSTPVSVTAALKGLQRTLGKVLPFKLESVAECSSRLKLLTDVLDVSALKLDSSLAPLDQELLRLQVAGLGVEVKEVLLEALGLVLLANNQVDPQKSVLEKLLFSVEQQHNHMTSKGLLEIRSRSEEEDPAGGARLSREEVLQLGRRVQLWPLTEVLAVLNQLRLSADLLSMLPAPDCLRRELSRHISFCLQATPMSVGLLQSLWFLLHSDRLVEALPLVWCQLLSEALAGLWTCSFNSEPDRWLKWEPLTREARPGPKMQHGAANTGPALLSKAVWSRGMVGVLGADGTGRWEPGGPALLSLCRVTLGEWKGRIQQLQDVSAVLWENMGAAALTDFGTDFRLQGAVLQQQLQSMAHLLPPSLQDSFMESCKNLVEDPNPLPASQEIQTVFRDFLPPDLFPDGLLRACSSCLQQYVQNKTQGSNTLSHAGVFWVNMGLLQIKVWTPQTIFDPALKRAYKLSYAQQEDEWRARSFSSQLMTGSELEESTMDGFQHPRIFLWVRMKQVKEQISELSRKQAHRPRDPQYAPLFQELQHYLSSVGRAAAIEELLSQLLKALQGSSKSRSAVQALLKEEAVWQNSQQRFCQKLLEDYPLYPDVVSPIRTGILQLRHGMRMVASQVAAALTPVPGLLQLMSCLLAFPSLSPSLPSDLARADFLCSTSCMDVLRSLMKLLPQQDVGHVVPQSSTLLLNALLYLQCHALSTGELSPEAHVLFRHICQALVNEWDEQERREKEKEQMEASLYRHRSRLHGSGLSEEEQEEKDFRSRFPQFNKDFADIVSQPTLEGPADSGLEDGEAQQQPGEAGVITPSVMNMVIAVHQRLCLGYARSLWYQNPTPANHSKHHIQALLSSYQIASPMMSRFYYLIVDQQLTGSGLVLSALLQNTVQSSGGLHGLEVASDGPYDFYQQPNMSEARLCLPVLEQLSQAVRQRLEDWPEHPALVQLTVVMDRILAFSLDSPLAKFLNGLEILLSKAQDWENNASRAVSLRKEVEAVTQLIIQWRKLELCWSNSLDNAMIRHSQKSSRHWFSIYQLVERYLEEQRTEVERLSLSSASSTLQAFIEGSSLGEFHTRLGMLLSFHCHLLLVPDRPGRSLSALLWNLHRYYSQFSDSIQTRISQLRQPIEKELRDFVKISRWNDVSFWSIKQSVEKTHTLFKFVKKFEEALNSPSVPALVEQGSSLNPDEVDANLEETPLHRVHQALRNAPPGKGKDLHGEGPEGDVGSLQARLPALFRKMKKMCVQLLKKSPLPELTEDLDCFTITNMRGLQSLNIDLTADKEKQKAEVKHILQQKQRALSDLFKMLAAILSYRKGLTWNRTADSEKTLSMPPLEMRLLTELLSAWDGCQKYFYRSWARRTALQTALQHAAKLQELGVGNIDRCRGFSSHLFKLLLGQRRRLVRVTESWVHLKLTSSMQSLKAHAQTPPEDWGCTLPPQDPLQDWVRRGRLLAAQCAAVLQQLSWLLQCCPEDGQQREHASSPPPLSCLSPAAAPRQPPGLLMRRGDAVWMELQQHVVERSNFDTCCSAAEQLGGVAAQMSGVEKHFSPSTSVGGPDCQPAVTQSLRFVRAQVEAFGADFTAWRTQLLSSEFSAELEGNINTVLCAVQTLVKRSQRDQEEEEKAEEEEEAPADLLKPGHLTRLLEEELEAELEALSAGDVCVRLEKLLHSLRSRRDSCSPQQLQEVNDACMRLLRLHPLLEVYCDTLRYYLSVSLGVHRSTGKLLSVLASIFTELAQKGFCLPQELMPGGDGEGATEFHDYEGGGIGEGEGTKDVSDKIENEDQVEDVSQEGQDKEEQQEKGNIKSEENAVEMSEDFDGQMHDGDENEEEDDESDKEEDEELDKKMGDLGEGQTDTLDERMWGDEEDEDEDGSEKEEESGQGMDFQRDFDENEVDPYHGQQDKVAEPEPMELPEDLALGDDEEGGDEEEENPFDLDDKVMDQEVKEEQPGDEGEGMEEKQPEEEEGQEPKTEEENKEEGGDGAEVKEEEEEPSEEKEEEKEERDGDAGNKEAAAVPVDKGADPKDEEEGEDEEQPDSTERKEHSTDGQTGDDNLQSDAAVEVAGEASQRDQAKEEHGSGAADASQSEGHESKLTARMASQSQTQRKTQQSYKRKPGRAEEERSTGDYNERINKRLRTVDSSEERSQKNKPSDGQQESDLYEHVREGEMDYDAQTYVASLEQQKAMGPQKNPNEDQEEEDVAMETEQPEEELKAAEVQELKPEQLDSSRSSRKGGEMEVQRQAEEEEDERQKDRQQAGDEERAERSTESTVHTVPELLMEDTQVPEELRKEMELQLEAWSRLGPGTQEESQAACMWHRYQNLTAALSQQLCEQLRLILEPTQAAKLGDYRTGKRLNMRKVIPYIASQFRKDKIWLRRTKPSKREYQICLAVDDSSSMVDNHSKQLAFESLSVIINALTLLEVGQVSVCFGEQMQLLHPFQQQFNDESGARILRLCQFQQKKTRIAQFLESSTKMFLSARQQIPGSFSSTAQLLLIVSDGRGLFLEGKERVTATVRAARNANIFVIFVVLDNPNSRQDSILDIKVPIFKGPGELPEIRSYMEEFPFPFYVILRDVNALPETLSDALRQWFELVTAADP